MKRDRPKRLKQFLRPVAAVAGPANRQQQQLGRSDLAMGCVTRTTCC
jgi:hypothetical protein